MSQQRENESSAAFVRRWSTATGSELANAQSFLRELCDLLGVDPPNPATDDPAANAYVFERAIAFQNPDCTTSPGRIDLYRRECFVLESKKVKAGPATKGFDDALLRARTQAENYARALPAAEGRPPFVVVVDVGNVSELYAEFTRSGATYTAFPDARSHRIPLATAFRWRAWPSLRCRLGCAPCGSIPTRSGGQPRLPSACRPGGPTTCRATRQQYASEADSGLSGGVASRLKFTQGQRRHALPGVSGLAPADQTRA